MYGGNWFWGDLSSQNVQTVSKKSRTWIFLKAKRIHAFGLAIQMPRLDVAVAKRFGISRTYAASLIRQGAVRLNGRLADKPGVDMANEATLECALPTKRYVGRGGHKLEAALAAFNINLDGVVCLDVGASTGGFTHCMLLHGAAFVHAIDVGTSQLAQQLRQDPRVNSLENTNILTIHQTNLKPPPSFATIDVSFVSATKILPHVASLTAPNGKLVILVKPQFECGRAALNRRGIVKDTKDHKRAVDKVIECGQGAGLKFCAKMPSPITGGDGNIEHLLYFENLSST